MMTDPIADMLTRIRNASAVKKSEVVIPYSKMKLALGKILVREGYLVEVTEAKEKHPVLVVKLKYKNGVPVIKHLKRISKPGHRKYIKSTEIKRVLDGYGLSLISTPKGIMKDSEARQANLGGELICEIY